MTDEELNQLKNDTYFSEAYSNVVGEVIKKNQDLVKGILEAAPDFLKRFYSQGIIDTSKKNK